MASLLNILNSQNTLSDNPGLPGSPNYAGNLDYPTDLYNKYPGDYKYVWEPTSLGYNVVNDSLVTPTNIESKDIDDIIGKDISMSMSKDNYIPFVSSVDNCNIPSYFVEDIERVKFCTDQLSHGLFKTALIINTIFSIIFYNKLNYKYITIFIIFHILLYYFITILFVDISIGEWNTFQSYKHAVKNDPDYSRFDTPVSQFTTITEFLLNQPINKQKIMYLILIVSFIFVWMPLKFNLISSEDVRFDINKLKR